VFEIIGYLRRREARPAGGFRLSDFDGLADEHELLRRCLRLAWPPSGAGRPRRRSHASDRRPERGGSWTFSRVLVLKWRPSRPEGAERVFVDRAAGAHALRRAVVAATGPWCARRLDRFQVSRFPAAKSARFLGRNGPHPRPPSSGRVPIEPRARAHLVKAPAWPKPLSSTRSVGRSSFMAAFMSIVKNPRLSGVVIAVITSRNLMTAGTA
jgi:hypothetical protein